jgi:toxin FitB
MILLDTNVVAEAMRPAPEAAVIDWLNRQDSSGIVLSTISVAEISYGLNCLVDGQRKRMLADRFEQTAVDLVNPWTAR